MFSILQTAPIGLNARWEIIFSLPSPDQPEPRPNYSAKIDISRTQIASGFELSPPSIQNDSLFPAGMTDFAHLLPKQVGRSPSILRRNYFSAIIYLILADFCALINLARPMQPIEKIDLYQIGWNPGNISLA
jgi:hypothetical protein